MRKLWISIFYIGLGFYYLTNVPLIHGQKENAAQDRSTGEWIMEFYVVHRGSGEPLPDVVLTVRASTENFKRQETWEEKTDSRGLCRIKLPDFQIETLRLYPKKEGFVPLFIMWRGIPTLPEVFTVAMEPSTTIGGVVRDERGDPIEGVEVGVHYQTPEPDAAENVHVKVMIHNAIETDIVTDASGRWTFDKMPAEIDENELRIFLKHPRYMSDQPRPGYIPRPITRQPSIDSLRDFSAVMVMTKGLEVTGKVTNKRGKPIAGAKIYDSRDYWRRSTEPAAETNAQGQFRTNASPGRVTWTAQAPGYAPDLRVIQIKAGMKRIEFHLEPGKVIEGKVTDQAGKPIGGAVLWAETWRTERRRLHLEAKTDARGNFKITDAPTDEVTFDIGKEGYMLLENYPMEPGGRRYDITLRPTLKVRGAVVDAQTERPINQFKIMKGIDPENGRGLSWQEFDVRAFTGGRYETEIRQETFTYRIRVDAEGYRPGLSHRIRPDEISESQIVCDFKLVKASLIKGVVLSPEGTPLPDAEVIIATDWLRILNGKIDPRSAGKHRVLRTDTNGEFHLEPPLGAYAMIVLSPQGYARITPDEFTSSRRITLSPWGCIEGMLRIGAKPGVNQLIAFWPESNRLREQPNIDFGYEVRTNEDGRFDFPRVIPGKGTVARAMPVDDIARRLSYHIDLDVKSGETTRIQIGGTGRPVIGRIVIPEIIRNLFDWQYTYGILRISSPINPPYKIIGLEFDKDGSFRTEDVPTGEYCLSMQVYGPPPNTRRVRGEMIGVLSRVFTVPEMPGGRSDEPLDLGALELQVIGKSELTPSLVGKPLPDLSGINIAPSMEQADGKMILTCFFDMNQRPSRRCINRLAEQTEKLMKKRLIIIAVQASKVDQDALDEWVKKNNIDFPIAMIQGDEEKTRFNWGVNSLPWLILTDKNHIVVAEGLVLDELDDTVAQMGAKN